VLAAWQRGNHNAWQLADLWHTSGCAPECTRCALLTGSSGTYCQPLLYATYLDGTGCRRDRRACLASQAISTHVFDGIGNGVGHFLRGRLIRSSLMILESAAGMASAGDRCRHSVRVTGADSSDGTANWMRRVRHFRRHGGGMTLEAVHMASLHDASRC
jgi:hypothetical protein